MTDQKKEESKNTASAKDRFQAEFDALPLDQKFAKLMKMEASTLNETLTYVANATMKGVEQLGDMMAEFGVKLENEAKKATKNYKAGASAPKGPTAKPKGRTTKKPSPPPDAK